MICRPLLPIASLLLVAAAPPAPAPIETLAEAAVARCLALAGAQRLTPLAIAVVDGSGSLVRFTRQPGAIAAISDAALLKARSALKLEMATADLAGAGLSDADQQLFGQLGISAYPGGHPIRESGRVIGAIGVSGAHADQDSACAKVAAVG